MRGSDRRAAWLLSLGLLPAVVVGVGLIVSVFGAVFGIPLLALVGRPWWVAARGVTARQPMGLRARSHTVIAVAVATLGFAVALVVGRDDIESVGDVALVGVSAALLVMCWLGAADRLRS